MKLFRSCLLAAISLVAIAPDMALSSTVTASGALGVNTIDFWSGDGAAGNVLGNQDFNGESLELLGESQAYISLQMDPFTLGDGADLNIITIALDMDLNPLVANPNTAAAIWVLVNGEFYNVGNTPVDDVYQSPTGVGGFTHSPGYVVFGGTGDTVAQTDGGFIDLNLFFGGVAGADSVYGDKGDIAITEVIISSYFGYNWDTGIATVTQEFGVDAIEANYAATAVPVPAAAWLFASGLIGLVAVSRKRIT